MMEQCFGTMDAEEMGSMMHDMMPKMMGGEDSMGMMPQCSRMMLPNMPNEKRIDFVLKMVDTLMEQGRVRMSKEEKQDFVAKVVERVKI